MQMNIKKQQFQQRKDAVKAAKEAKEAAEKEAAAAKEAQARAQGELRCVNNEIITIIDICALPF